MLEYIWEGCGASALLSIVTTLLSASVYGIHTALGLLSLQLPKFQTFPIDFLPSRLYLIGIVCNQNICIFKSFAWLGITGLN